MANENYKNAVSEARARVNEQKRAMNDASSDYKKVCFHHPEYNNGDGMLVQLTVDEAKAMGYGPSDTVYRCNECGAVFDAKGYTSEQIRGARLEIESILEQLKFNSKNMDAFPGKQDMLMQYYAGISLVKELLRGYDRVTNQKDKNNNGGGNRPKSRGTVGQVKPYGSRRGY